MSQSTKIEWTDKTWNPTVGCTKVSPGCKNCYAEAMAKRLQGMGIKGYENGFELSIMPGRLYEPLRHTKPSMFFVNSMSDLCHEDIPDTYIEEVLKVISFCPQHIFQILTKRPERMADFFNDRKVPDNVWLGVSVEDRKYGLPRAGILSQINAPIRFLSVEPLLEDLGEIDLSRVHWVVVGGESGARARKMDKCWVTNIQYQCYSAGVRFFFKQWGAWGEDGVRRSAKRNGRALDGVFYNDTPDW